MRLTSASDGMLRRMPCMTTNASRLPATLEQSSRRTVPSTGTSRTSALAISRSSATHHTLPVPDAKSLAT